MIKGWLCCAAGGLAGLIALSLAVLSTRGQIALDGAAQAWAVSSGVPPWLAIAAVVTELGAAVPVTLLTGSVAIVLALRIRRLAEPVVLVVAVALTSSLVFWLKIGLARIRPPTAIGLGERVTDYAFPSGHTATGSVALVLSALLLARTWRSPAARGIAVAVAVVLAVLVGVSRVYLGYHWATDVIGGWFLALLVVSLAMVATGWIARRRPELPRGQTERRPAVERAASPGRRSLSAR